MQAPPYQKGQTHESGRFDHGATAATGRHRQPVALLFVVVSSSLYSSSSSMYQLNYNSTTRMSMERQAASPIAVPNLRCVPQLFASGTLGTQLEELIIAPGLEHRPRQLQTAVLLQLCWDGNDRG